MSAADPDAHLNELPTLEESAALGSNSPVANSGSNFSNSRSSSSSRSEESNASFSSETNPESLSLDPCDTGSKIEVEKEVDNLLTRHAAGDLEPLPIVLADLPVSASDSMRRVAAFFALVYGLRRAEGFEHDPVLFSGRWVARHLSGRVRFHERTAARAIKRLVAAGVLVKVGEMPPLHAGWEGTGLYLPGPVVSEAAPVGVERRAGDVREVVEPHPEVVDEPLVPAAVGAVGDGSVAASGHGARDVLRGGVQEGSDPGRHGSVSTSSPSETHPQQAWPDPDELVAALTDAFDAEEIPPDPPDTGSGQQERAVGGKRPAAAPLGRDLRLARPDGACGGDR